MSQTSTRLETPFTTAALGSDASFWESYIASRPSPSEDFFRLINEYHASHGDSRMEVAHDVGTGPGNIAARLARYYDQVVGSDVNEQALDAAPKLISPDLLKRMTFVRSPAEGLVTAGIPTNLQNTDLLVVSECMPLLDAPRALEAFHTLIRPGGTVAIYFYGRPIFQDPVCDAIYDRMATRICQFLLPFQGTPGEPFHRRGAEGLVSFLDNIALPASDWENVERHKWNCDYPLLFNSPDGFDFEFHPVDRRGEGDITHDIVDRDFWAHEWDADNVKAYLDSVYPHYRGQAGESYAEVEAMCEELRAAMGGKQKVTFSVVLVLGTRK
ncbi:hypothetical protein N7517_000951 [Penicillium concentricum]|uniref:Methyltransferase domain-containing protein n=1 Tax=Penicillium concentricum TaxID=293559 RepID=A0A9W9SRZ9_9EURO|nr:uncharacterized protein N7517_000951 [Penicillium concentricum]KAJ5383040.1 hypothetical protein N7517_000951 [Penicillium concentricum]